MKPLGAFLKENSSEVTFPWRSTDLDGRVEGAATPLSSQPGFAFS